MKRGESGHIPFLPSEAQNANQTVLLTSDTEAADDYG